MRRKLSYILVSSAIALGALPLSASMLVVYTSTTSLSDTQGNVKGNPNESAPGFGEGSWQATGKKTNYYVTPFELFGTSTVKISDIASMSYWTNQAGSLGSNWNLYIY